MAIRKKEENVNGCDCIHGDIPVVRDSEEGGVRGDDTTVTTTIPGDEGASTSSNSYSNFVWATGGASTAAGHGNLLNETYTAFLERAVKDVFAAVGIGFEARNYAIGGIR